MITVGTKMCQHIASRKDMLDGARLEIRLASTQDQSTLRISRGHASQFDLQLTRRESLSVIYGGTCRFCPDSSKCAASGAAGRENRLNNRYEKKLTVKDSNTRGS